MNDQFNTSFAKISLSVLVVITLCFAQKSIAQTLDVDSNYRPAIYDTRLGQFRSFPNSTKDIVFLGNSIMSYANWAELFNNPNAKNRGIPGDITFGLLQRLDEVTEGKPAKVFILIGINDIGRKIPDQYILANYKKIIKRIKEASPKTKIYFHTLLPVNNTFKPMLSHFNKDEHILFVNAELKKIAQEEQIGLIDLYSEFLDAENRLDKRYSFDGLHLNDLGYLKWAELLKKGKYF